MICNLYIIKVGFWYEALFITARQHSGVCRGTKIASSTSHGDLWPPLLLRINGIFLKVSGNLEIANSTSPIAGSIHEANISLPSGWPIARFTWSSASRTIAGTSSGLNDFLSWRSLQQKTNFLCNCSHQFGATFFENGIFIRHYLTWIDHCLIPHSLNALRDFPINVCWKKIRICLK